MGIAGTHASVNAVECSDQHPHKHTTGMAASASVVAAHANQAIHKITIGISVFAASAARSVIMDTIGTDASVEHARPNVTNRMTGTSVSVADAVPANPNPAPNTIGKM